MRLVCEGLTAGYPQAAGLQAVLHDLSCVIESGERVALLGPSGAGKSTFLKVLGAMHPVGHGRVTLDGTDPAQLSTGARRRLRRRIASIPQGHDLVERLDCRRNVLAGRSGSLGLLCALRVLVWPLAREAAAADAALARVGLGGFAERRADQLSGGQHQRVAIARACYQGAELLLADEPVASLDRVLAEAILTQLATIVDDDRRTLVVSLHDPALARRCCTRAIGLRSGRIVVDVPMDRLDDHLLKTLYA